MVDLSIAMLIPEQIHGHNWAELTHLTIEFRKKIDDHPPNTGKTMELDTSLCPHAGQKMVQSTMVGGHTNKRKGQKQMIKKKWIEHQASRYLLESIEIRSNPHSGNPW